VLQKKVTDLIFLHIYFIYYRTIFLVHTFRSLMGGGGGVVFFFYCWGVVVGFGEGVGGGGGGGLCLYVNEPV